MSIEKRDYTPQTVHLEVAGHEFEMRRMTGAEWVAMRRLDTKDFTVAMTEAALDAIVDSSLPDGAALNIDEAIDLMNGWIAAHKEDAVPPA
jgi:hypothetical protein